MGNTCSCCSKAIRFPQVEEVSDLDEAISFIETRLDAILIDKPEEGTSRAETTTNSAGVASYIKYGSYFLEKVRRRVERHTCKIVKLNRNIQKVVIDILKGAQQIHWVGAGLGVVAYVLDQMDIITTNRNEHVELLRFMCGVAKHLKQRVNHLPPEKLNDGVVFIIKGSFFCVSRMQSTHLSSSFSALVDEEGIKSLQSQLTIKYPELGQYPDEDDKQNLPEDDILSCLDELMTYIEKCLAKPIATDKAEESTSRVASSIKYGSDLLENVLKRCKRRAFNIMSPETMKVVIDVLKEASQIHWVAAGLSVVAYVLQKVDDASTNKEECVKHLHYMYGLAKHIKQLNGHISTKKLHDVAEFIFKGSFFCISRIKSSDLSRFFSSVVDVEEMRSLQSELDHNYKDLTLETVTQLLNQKRRVLPPSQGKHPDAVGINDARDKVIGLLDLTDESTRGVVLYGVGGIGKTTLATAVFSSLELDAYKYCKVDIQQDCTDSDLKKLQEQVLDDLFEQKIKLRNCEEGKAKLSNLFKDSATQPMFLFIDNSLRASDLAKLLPKDLSCLPNRSRILITTRKLGETDMIEKGGVKRHSYCVSPLSDADSEKLLCLNAFGGADKSFDKSLGTDRLLKICRGMPLVLEMAGLELRKLGNDVRAVESTHDFLKDTIGKGEGELSEKIVDVVYNTLQYGLHKDAFLDIAVFFHNWNRRIVGYIVGEVALTAIQEAALVKISKSKEGKVIVHDIVQARGKKLSEEDRITDHQSLQRALEHTQRLEKLKGIWLPRKPSTFQLQAEDLDKMHKCLRVLHLEIGTKVTGACTKEFENLRYLVVHKGDCSPMELNKLPRLAVFDGRIRTDDRFCDLPDSLCRLRVKALKSHGLDESFGKLSRLEELELSQNEQYMTSLPQSFGQLQNLGCLELYNFRELNSLPETFGQLSNLKNLIIEDCKKLSSLSDNFGQLKALEHLRIRGCESLQRLSDDFGSLARVAAIDASRCPVLVGKAVHQMIELKSLIMLNIEESQLLIKRWEEIKEGHPQLVLTESSLGYSRMLKDSMSRALFDRESRFVNDDGVEIEWSSSFRAGDEKNVFLVTCCDLCSSASEKACEMVKKKIVELSCEGFHIMYVGLMEQSEENIGRTLRHLCGGTSLCAWIPPSHKWKQLFGFSAYKMVSLRKENFLRTSAGGVHTFMGLASGPGVPGQELNVIFPTTDKEKEVMTIFGGGFTSLYSREIDIERKVDPRGASERQLHVSIRARVLSSLSK